MKKKLFSLFLALVITQAVVSAYALLLKRRYSRQVVGPGEINAVAVMGGARESIANTDFRGGFVRAVMGGIELDCREARIVSPPARIEATVLMGGAQLKVPPEWAVQLEANVMMGGAQDTRPASDARTGRAPDLIISASITMGGLEIK